MKTNSNIRKSLGTVLLISTVLMSNYFTSCENFLKGSEIIDSLNSAIDYANAESYTIRISADDGTGIIITGAGDRDLKVTDTINVGFKVSPGYKFVRWEAVKKSDETVFMSDYVEFEDKTALETKVKLVKKSDDLLIKPLCEFSMDFTSCIPVNNTKSGIERNSQIELTFKNPLSTENDVSKIQILIEDDKGEVENGALYFQLPVITENKIIIKSVKDNLIPVQQGELKTVTVVIPEDFKYVGANNEEKSIGFEMSYSYTVNYQTCDKLHVVFGLEERDGGKFKVQSMYGESFSLVYSQGQVDTIIFKPSADYRFLNWEYAKDGHLLVDEKLNDVINNLTYVDGYCKEDNSYAAKIEIFNSSNEDTDFLFKAKVEEIPTAEILISSTHGKISPNGKISYKEGEKVNLMFTADSDYQFISWKVFDKKTNTEITDQDFIIFHNKSEENTYFTFNCANSDMEFMIEPVCEERPKVIFTIPQNGERNIVRNRSIRIVFSKSINEEMINENIHIYEGVQRVIGGELIYDKYDISDKVDFELSGNTKKTLFIKLKENSLFNPSSYVSVDIDKKLKDTKNASFENDYSLQFQTSNYVDSLAPRINNFSAGLNSEYEGLPVYSQDTPEFNTIEQNNAYTKNVYSLASAVTINDSTNENYLNFYVDAGDISGAKETAGTDVVEANVKNILYRISRYNANPEGKLEKDDSFLSATYYIPYNAKNYSDDTMQVDGKSFGELTKNEKEVGCIARYNLNQLEDGLYRFDISTEDNDGNNGFEEEFYSQHKNGYKSVFVAKDTKTLQTGTPQWIDSSNNVDNDYVFKRTSNSDIEKILRIPYDQTYFGIKTIELGVDKTDSPLESLNLKVRYGKTETYNPDLPEIEIESKSGSTITLKEYNSSYATTGYLFIENLCLGLTHGEVKINAKLTDRLESKIQQAMPSQIAAYNDQMPPYFNGGSAGSIKDKGLITVKYSYSEGTATENVWPRPGKEGIKSTEFWGSPDIRNGDGVPVRWFYTNALNSSNNYCVRLNFDLEEDKTNIKIYSKKHSSSLLSDANLKTITNENSGATLLTTISNTSSCDYTFELGTWTVYMEDSVGNKSPAYTFVVVEDSTGPVMATNEGRDLKHLITVPIGETGQPNYDFRSDWDAKWNKNTNPSNGSLFFDWWDGNPHKIEYMTARSCNIYGTMAQIKNAKYVVKLSGATGSERTIYEDASKPTNGSQSPNAKEYWEDAKPSRTSSGISQYYIGRVYKDWRSDSRELFIPAFPEGTKVDDRYVKDILKTNVDSDHTDPNKATVYKNLFGKDLRTYKKTYGPNSTYYNKYFDDWQPYVAGSNIEIPIFKDYGRDTTRKENYKGVSCDVYRQPPIALCFKDNCGNLNYIMCTRPDWQEYSTWLYNFYIK